MIPSTEATSDLADWLSSNWITIVVITIGLFLVWRFARPFIHRAVTGLLGAQERAMPTGAPDEELAKRAATLEDLFNSLVRAAVGIAIVFLIFGLLGLWPAVAGLGLVLAALTFAGQSVILDYIMGILILFEGQYYKGDTVRLGDVQGTVEEVGLRRTVVRDAKGIVHSVSNGTIRVSANLTRVFAVAVIDITGVRNADVEAVIAIMDRVGGEIAADADWADLIVGPPGYRSTSEFTDLGVTLIMTAKVRTQARWSVPAEIRRRLALAFASANIHLRHRSGAAGAPDTTTADVTGTGAAGRPPT